MSTHLILNRQPRGKCRICKHVFYDSDSDRVIGEHNARCAQAHAEATHEQRHRLDFLNPQDPELQAWVTKAYKQGTLKPSTERVK